MRIINRGSVLKAVAAGGTVSRQSLAEQTGLTTAAISRITRQLLNAGMLAEVSSTSTTAGRGRRSSGLKLSDNGAYLVVMVISANRRAVAIANCSGDLLACKELSSVSLTPAKKAIAKFCDTAKTLHAKLSAPASRVLGVSVVVAINNNPSNHKILSSDVLGWRNVNLKNLIESAMGLPVHLEARSVALLQAEMWKSTLARNKGNVFLVNNGWRLGSSVFVNNEILETEENRLGQVAHLALSTSSKACYCGNSGCLDALASGEAIVKTLEEKGLMEDTDSTPPTEKLVTAIQLAEKNQCVAEVFGLAGQKLGEGLSTVATLFTPERIVLAGATARQPDYVYGVGEIFSGGGGCNLTTCTADSLEAAIRTGLNAFVFSEALNLQQLEQAPLSA